MTSERLKELNGIEKEINNIKKSIEALNSTERLRDDLVLFGSRGALFLDKEYVDFKILKQLTLASLNEKLAKLEKEFNEA